IQLLDRLKIYDSDKDFVRLLHTAYSAEPPFLVYQYIDGGNLDGWLDSFAGKPPPAAEILSVLKMTARAVAAAHAQGIVHRDLKPANLLITSKGRVKVGDFGIGAVVAESGGATPARGVNPTFLHHAVTPVYADPWRERAGTPDPRDDVYALGVIGFQLLAGSTKARMEGGWRRWLKARGAPAELVDIIETCVAPPEERYVDAGALLAALEQCGGRARAKAKDTEAKARPKSPPVPK